jgi:hypothetical protein
MKKHDIVQHIGYPNSVFLVVGVERAQIDLVLAMNINRKSSIFKPGKKYKFPRDAMNKLTSLADLNFKAGEVVRHQLFQGAEFKVLYWDNSYYLSGRCVREHLPHFKMDRVYHIHGALLERAMKKPLPLLPAPTPEELLKVGDYFYQDNNKVHDERASNALFVIEKMNSNGTVMGRCEDADDNAHHYLGHSYIFDSKCIKACTLIKPGDALVLANGNGATFRSIQPTIKAKGYWDCLCIEGSNDYVRDKIYPLFTLSVLKKSWQPSATIKVGDIFKPHQQAKSLFKAEEINQWNGLVTGRCIFEDLAQQHTMNLLYYFPPSTCVLANNKTDSDLSTFKKGLLFSLAEAFETNAQFEVTQNTNLSGLVHSVCVKEDAKKNFIRNVPYIFHYAYCFPVVSAKLEDGDFFRAKGNPNTLFEAQHITPNGITSVCICNGGKPIFDVGGTYFFDYESIEIKEKPEKKSALFSDNFFVDYWPGDWFSISGEYDLRSEVIEVVSEKCVRGRVLLGNSIYQSKNICTIPINKTKPIRNLQQQHINYKVGDTFYVRSAPDLVFRVNYVDDSKETVGAICIYEGDQAHIKLGDTLFFYTIQTCPIDLSQIALGRYCTLLSFPDTLFQIVEHFHNSPFFEATCLRGDNGRSCYVRQRYTLHCAFIRPSYALYNYQINQIFTLLEFPNVFFKVSDNTSEAVSGVCITGNYKYLIKDIYTFDKGITIPTNKYGLLPFQPCQLVRLVSCHRIRFEVLPFTDCNTPALPLVCKQSVEGSTYKVGNNYIVNVTNLLPLNAPLEKELVAHDKYEACLFQAKEPKAPFGYLCTCLMVSKNAVFETNKDYVFLIEHLKPFVEPSSPLVQGELVHHKSCKESRFRIDSYNHVNDSAWSLCLVGDSEGKRFIYSAHYLFGSDELVLVNSPFPARSFVALKREKSAEFEVVEYPTMKNRNKISLKCLRASQGSSFRVGEVHALPTCDVESITVDYNTEDVIGLKDNSDARFCFKYYYMAPGKDRLNAICTESGGNYFIGQEYILETEDTMLINQTNKFHEGQLVTSPAHFGSLFEILKVLHTGNSCNVRCLCPDKEQLFFNMGKQYNLALAAVIPIFDLMHDKMEKGWYVRFRDRDHIVFKISSVGEDGCVDAVCVVGDEKNKYYKGGMYKLCSRFLCRTEFEKRNSKYSSGTSVVHKNHPTGLFEVLYYVETADYKLVKVCCLRKDAGCHYKIGENYEFQEEDLVLAFPQDEEMPIYA